MKTPAGVRVAALDSTIETEQGQGSGYTITLVESAQDLEVTNG